MTWEPVFLGASAFREYVQNADSPLPTPLRKLKLRHYPMSHCPDQRRQARMRSRAKSNFRQVFRPEDRRPSNREILRRVDEPESP